MISILILVFTLGALGQFFVAYCRTLLLTYEKVEMTQRTRDVAGLAGNVVPPNEFVRLMQLLRVAPDPGDDVTEIAAVSVYYHVMNFAGRFVSPLSQSSRRWIDRELSRCAYFAAITLDRRLAPAAN
ncbi:MAG: hypothetical protein WBP79_03510 [Candidatus Acidiferrales bacterium]